MVRKCPPAKRISWAVAFSIFLFVFSACLIQAASPPQPTYGTADVDGNTGEWDQTNDFFANMYRAGDPTKKVESKLHLRYDCATSTMYALVLTVTGVPALVEPDNAWIAIDGAATKVVTGNSGDDGTPPDFQWVGIGFDGNNNHAQGWEASFSLAPGNYKILAHVNVFDDGESQTSAVDRKTNQDGIDLVIICALQDTITIIKNTVPYDPQDFAYTTRGGLNPAAFSLDDDTDPALSNTQTYTNVASGTYTVTETLPVAGFVLTSLVCSDPNNNSSTDLATGTATINLEAGEAITCTFTNTKQAPLVEAEKQASLFKDNNGNGKVNPGDLLLYTVTITNTGALTATNVTYSDTVDTNTDLICSGSDAPTTSQGSISNCSPGAGGNLQVNVGNVAQNGSVTITYKVEVRTGNFKKVLNQGVVAGDNFVDESTDDPDTVTDDDRTEIPVEPETPPIGGDPPIWGDIVVFPTPEWALGRDLNGDGDTLDTVLRYKNLRTGELAITGIPVSGIPRSVDLYEDTVVFVLQESSFLDSIGFNLLSSPLGTTGPIGTYNLRTGKVQMLGVWGSRPSIYQNIISISGNTVRYYDLKTGKLVDTGIPGQNQALWGRKIAYQYAETPNGSPLIYIYDIDTGAVISTGVPGSSPAIYENVIAFTGSDNVIHFYDLSTKKLTTTGEAGVDPQIYGQRIVFESMHHIRYFDMASGSAFDTGELGFEPDIYEGTITYFVWERLRGQDLSGDRDQQDPIVLTHQISSSDRLLARKTPPALSAPSTLSISRVLSAPQGHGIRFEIQGIGVESLQLEVYDLGGHRVFDSGFRRGTSLTWDLATPSGHRPANGVYLYVMKARGPDGQVIQSRIQKLLLLR